MYFGPAACKPISVENTKLVFAKLDANRDGLLDKAEFQTVLALLMGNVMSRIFFQFACTLLIVPVVAQAVLSKTMDLYYGYLLPTTTVVTTVVMTEFQDKYQPLLEMALCWDLIQTYGSIVMNKATDYLFQNNNNTTIDLGLGLLQGGATAAQLFVADKYDVFIRQPIHDIPQETWDSLPLTLLSAILTMIIVPYSILKTDDFFQWLANRFGGSKKAASS